VRRAPLAAIVVSLLVGCGKAPTVDDGTLSVLEQAVTVRPTDPAAWAALVDARLQDARSGDHLNQASGTFTPSGMAELRQARQEWGRYLALKPSPPSVSTAREMSGALGPAGLNDLVDAVAAQEIVVAHKTTDPAEHARLALLAYLAGQTATGDRAAAQAVHLSPTSQRSVLGRELAAVKAGAQGAAAVHAP
jgi:hypothetical protein